MKPPMGMKRLQALFTPLVLALGTATFLFLLWKFEPARVWGHLVAFGWGFAVLLPFPILDHMINAAGWKLSFPPDSSGKVRFRDLVRVRIAGDGVNYLTPSANIAGEFVRPGMIDAGLPLDVRMTSVLVAKIAQTAAQVFFIFSGLGYLLHARLFDFEGTQATLGAVGVGGIFLGIVIGVSLLVMKPPKCFARRFPAAVQSSAPVRTLLKSYLLSHPVRLLSSIACFMLGYAWGAAEIWIICRFLGAPVGLEMAFSIELFSNMVDSLAFMVPAKIGTQEGGKAVIFKALGLRPELGFTLGIIRHVREIAWAGLGLALYAAHAKRAPSAG
ncbi:MAG: lysylphosphatidylglycerol synthase domain-containing protein [Elusimicrobiota bacterium]